MSHTLTLGIVLLLTALAQTGASIVGYHMVRDAFGISGPMCPSRTIRTVSASAYLVLLAAFVGVIGGVVCWARREDASSVRAMVAGAIIATGLFLGLQALAVHLPAVRAAALTQVVTVNTVAAWGHAVTVGVGAAMAFHYRRGGPTRG